MGPPEFTGGNEKQRITVLRAVSFASMGPPEFTGGNTATAAEKVQDYHRLQWGRRNSPAETLGAPLIVHPRQPASMGPPEFTGGNRAEITLQAAHLVPASMGPPEFTGGNHLTW